MAKPLGMGTHIGRAAAISSPRPAVVEPLLCGPRKWKAKNLLLPPSWNWKVYWELEHKIGHSESDTIRLFDDKLVPKRRMESRRLPFVTQGPSSTLWTAPKSLTAAPTTRSTLLTRVVPFIQTTKCLSLMACAAIRGKQQHGYCSSTSNGSPKRVPGRKKKKVRKI